MTLVVLAAGMGSRYGGMKQIDPITSTGEFILDFSVYDALRAGFDKVIFVIKEEMLKDFEETVGKRINGKIKVEYAFQKPERFVGAERIPEGRTKPFGTTHAVLCAREKITDNFAVINADDFYGREAFATMAEHLRSAADQNGVINAAMVGYILGNTLTENGTVSRGVCKVENDGYLSSIVETTQILPDGETAAYIEGDKKYPLPYNTMVSMNFWGFTPSILNYLEKDFEAFMETLHENPLKKECYLPLSVDNAMKAGCCKVKTFLTEAKWYGVTYSDDKPGVVAGIRKLIDTGVYPDGLWK